VNILIRKKYVNIAKMA